MSDRDDELSRDIAAVQRMRALPALLATICEMSGMGVATVARVRAGAWTACAVHDAMGHGLRAGDALPVDARRSSIATSAPNQGVVEHPAPRVRAARNCLSARIELASGELFGHLCAFDPRPADPAAPLDPRALAMVARFAGLVADHIDADRQAQSARAALDDERAAAALRDEFSAILSHDLRNPLSAILAWARVLQTSGADRARAAKAGARIESSATRMAALVDNLLDHARARLGGGLDARIEPVDNLAAALEDVVDELGRANPDRETLSRVEIPGVVRCDKGRIQQLASNLLGNAIVHGDPAGPVELQASVRDAILEIRVWNSGDPIPADHMDMVFKPFWRASASGDRHGLGLGLHICDMIVKSHGGTLSVDSDRELGTAFTARIPIAA